MDTEFGGESGAALPRNDNSSLTTMPSVGRQKRPPGRSDRPQRGVHSVAGLVAAMLLLGACTGSSNNDGGPAATRQTTVPTEGNGPFDTTVPSAPDSAIAAPTTIGSSVVAVSAEPLNRGGTTGVFALVELPGGGRGVRFGTSLNDPIPLPTAALEAVPDGRRGFVFVSEDQVWWQSEPVAEPLLVEDPGVAVDLVGLRVVGGMPVVLVLIGEKLIGYDRGAGRLVYVFDQFTGRVRQLAIEGDIAVAIVTLDDGTEAVERVKLSTGRRLRLAAAVSAKNAAAPLAVAVSQGRVAILRHSLPVRVVGLDGEELGSIGLGIDPGDVSSIDLAGTNLLVAFGEAATTTDIVSGDRTVVETPSGWVLGAVWADRPPGPPVVTDGTRFRVDTDTVLANTADPFLNVRWAPGVTNPLLAKLPADYIGLSWTNDEQTTSDGAVWYRVELLDPVAITPPRPLGGARPSGWVNSAFLLPLPDGLPVTTSEVPACTRGGTPVSATTGDRPPGHVYALETQLIATRCLRTVLSFGTGNAPFGWDDVSPEVQPANAIPETQSVGSGASAVVVDLGGIESVWMGATETPEGVYIVRTDNVLQLWSPVPVERISISALPDRGMIVVDMVLFRDVGPPPADAGVVLTRHPRPGVDSIEVTGIARPFEANLGVTIEDSSGEAVEAVYAGSLSLGTIATTDYSAQTEDWLQAWAPFAVRAEALDGGLYTLILDAEGARDDPDTLRLPFTLLNPEPTSDAEPTALATRDEQDIVRALVGFARGNGSAASVPFADEVVLGISLAETRTLTREQLADADAWESLLSDFEGFTGPFNALDTLAQSPFVRFSAGPIPRCAGPPLDWPAQFAGLRQISIEPIAIDSCLQWFAVSVFLNTSGAIEAVVLDLVGP